MECGMTNDINHCIVFNFSSRGRTDASFSSVLISRLFLTFLWPFFPYFGFFGCFFSFSGGTCNSFGLLWYFWCRENFVCIDFNSITLGVLKLNVTRSVHIQRLSTFHSFTEIRDTSFSLLFSNVTKSNRRRNIPTKIMRKKNKNGKRVRIEWENALPTCDERW